MIEKHHFDNRLCKPIQGKLSSQSFDTMVDNRIPNICLTSNWDTRQPTRKEPL